MQKTVYEKQRETFSAGQQFRNGRGDESRFVAEFGERQTGAEEGGEGPHAGIAVDDTRVHIAF